MKNNPSWTKGFLSARGHAISSGPVSQGACTTTSKTVTSIVLFTAPSAPASPSVYIHTHVLSPLRRTEGAHTQSRPRDGAYFAPSHVPTNTMAPSSLAYTRQLIHSSAIFKLVAAASDCSTLFIRRCVSGRKRGRRFRLRRRQFALLILYLPHGRHGRSGNREWERYLRDRAEPSAR